MAGSEIFRLEVRATDQGPLVVLAGDVDLSSVPRLRECLVSLAGERITLDFADVTFLDSTGIGMLVAAQTRAKSNGGDIVLHRVQPTQMHLFEMVGLTTAFDFDGDQAA